MSDAKPKTRIFNLRLTADDREALRVNAALAGVSAGEYIRRMCCGEPAKTKKKEAQR
tara:strand:+ start:1120 stop:1290 length:171 start_codon:yes stop_codon:yes gene_type:complete